MDFHTETQPKDIEVLKTDKSEIHQERIIIMSNVNAINARIISVESLQAITSKIGRDVTFEGNFVSDDPNACLNLEGRFQGAIRFEKGGLVHVGASAVIMQGVVVADHIFIEGIFEGSVHARKSLEITGTAVVSGSVRYDEKLDLHAGARMKATMEYSGDMGERKVEEAPKIFALGGPMRAV